VTRAETVNQPEKFRERCELQYLLTGDFMQFPGRRNRARCGGGSWLKDRALL
jgi:hypothetical protein